MKRSLRKRRPRRDVLNELVDVLENLDATRYILVDLINWELKRTKRKLPLGDPVAKVGEKR